MAIWAFVAHLLGSLAGVGEIVDDQNAGSVAAGFLDQAFRNVLDDDEIALVLVFVIGGDADRLDVADAQFAGDDGSRNQPASGDGDDCLPAAQCIAHARQPPGERLAIAVELVPGDGKCFRLAGHEKAFR